MIDWNTLVQIITGGLVASGVIFGVAKIIWGSKVKPECTEARKLIVAKSDKTMSDSKRQLAELRSIATSLVELEKRFNETKGYMGKILDGFKELIFSKIDAQSNDIAEIKKAVNGKSKQSKG